MIMIKRKALLNKLKGICLNPLTVLCAPNGYGKTTAVREYLFHEKFHHAWLLCNELQDEAAFFKALIEQLSPFLSGHEAGDVLQTCIQENPMAIFPYVDRVLTETLVLVIDDYRYITKQVDNMINAGCSLSNHHLHIVVTTHALNKGALFSSYQTKACHIIPAKNLVFQPKEMEQLAEKEGVPLQKKELEELYQYTYGWVYAVILCLRAYRDNHSFYNANGCARLIEETLYFDWTKEVKAGMISLSVLHKFTLDQAQYVCQSEDTVRELIALENMSTFVVRSTQQDYEMTPMIRDYLKQQLFLSNKKMKQLYCRAAEWYIIRKDLLQAIAMYLESGNFEEIIALMQRYDVDFMDKDQQLMLEVFNRMPKELYYRYPYVYLVHICDNMTNIDAYHGIKLLEEFKVELEQGKYQGDYRSLLGEYYFIHAFSHYNDVGLMMKDFHLAYDAFDGGKSKFAYPSMIATFGSFHILYLYYHTAGTLRELVELIHQEVSYFTHISHGVNAGGRYQVSAEYALETGNYADVMMNAALAYNEAMSNKQYSIVISTLFVRARLAILQKNETVYEECVNAIRNLPYQRDVPIISGEVDCALAYLSIMKQQEDDIAPWLKNNDSSDEKLLHEAAMISNMIKALYHLKKGEYHDALVFCNVMRNAYKQQMHIFGELYAVVFTAIIMEKTEHLKEAQEHLSQALDIAQKDHIVTLFVEFYEDIISIMERIDHPLISEIQQLANELEDSCSQQNDISDTLTKKEKEIVKMLISNKTVRAIAEEKVISMNTVQTHMKSIYKKLEINSKYELIELLKDKI